MTLSSRAEELLQSHKERIYRRTDRMFAVLLVVQWGAAILGALALSPRTWSGSESAVHPHVWMAVIFGGLLCSLPTALVILAPGRSATRYTIAVAQMMFSSILIHISGGRVETHFHIFGSLAFLAAYRDWKLLLPATLIVAVDHFVRGLYWPETVFGISTASQWRWMEHAAWVLFEDVFLIVSIRQSATEMRRMAQNTAEMESNHARVQEIAEEMNRAFERERAVIEGALDGVILMDLAGNVVDWNPQAEKTFGWSRDEALGRQLSQMIIPEQYREAHNRGLEIYRKTGVGPVLNSRIELEAVRRSGEAFPVELAITPVVGTRETIFCAFIRDITDRKTAESSLHRAKEQAETANRAKSEFLANMSHEIRTPLTGILGFTEVLRRGSADEAQRASHLQVIQSSGQHLLTLINDILDLSKIEAGRMEFERVPCSPQEVIADVLSILRVPALEKRLRLDCRWLTPVPQTIVTDPARLRQLLMNLVSNAIKFTEAGGVELRGWVHAEGDEPRLVIEVEDTGIGIPETHLERIFRPFDQADNSITRRFGGTGLGLTICRFIAEALGGEVTVRSETGRGSVFRVTIATGDLDGVEFHAAEAWEALRPSAAPKQAAAGCELAGVRVLLVEDGDTNRDLISLVLTEAGATVVCAENGQEGVRAAGRASFDVILMDMQMPVMDGYTAAQTLRASGSQLPIIALTAHAMRGDREKCLMAGCSDYLVKPIEIDRLLETVQRSVGRDETGEREPAEAGAGGCDGESWRIVSTLPMEHPRFQRIVESFVATLEERLERMDAAWRESEWDALAELAHWLKGAGGTVGFGCFTRPAAQLEQAARAADAGGARRSLEQLHGLTHRIELPAAAGV